MIEIEGVENVCADLDSIKDAIRAAVEKGLHAAAQVFEDEIRSRTRVYTGGRLLLSEELSGRLIDDLTSKITLSPDGGTALTGAMQHLQMEYDEINKKVAETQSRKQLDTARAAQDESIAGKPLTDRMNTLDAQLDAVKAKLAAIGKPEAAQILAKAFGDATKAIRETNDALAVHGRSLTDAQKTEIRQMETAIANAEAESQWRTKFVQSTTAIGDRIRSVNLLTSAIGRIRGDETGERRDPADGGAGAALRGLGVDGFRLAVTRRRRIDGSAAMGSARWRDELEK